MQRNVFLTLVVFCCLSATAYADPSITAGNWTINPAAGQSIDAISALPIAVLTSGGEGDDFAGTDLALNVEAGGPVFEAVNLLTGVFAGNNTGQTDFLAFGGLDQYSLTTTTAGTVGPNGTLAFITFNGTGVAPGTYDFSLTNFIGASDLPPFTAAMTLRVDGTVTVIPEPGSIVLAVFAAGGVCAVAIRRRRKMA